MNDLLELFKNASPALVVAIATVYFLKVFLEKSLEGIAGRVEELAKTSLDVKKEIRAEERSELVAFRVAVEEWEDFLQTAIFDFAMQPASGAQVAPLYQKDKELFLKVKIAVVKAGMYLRDNELEHRLMAAVLQLRKTYYPIINERIPRLIDLQSRISPIVQKIAKFEQSGLLDTAVAPTARDRDEYAELLAKQTEEMQLFSQRLRNEYPGIAQQLVTLKEVINDYVYRPIGKASVVED
ncbi:MAG: hypothetical protein ABR929_07855 [Roseiarcus sp.]